MNSTPIQLRRIRINDVTGQESIIEYESVPREMSSEPYSVGIKF